MASPGRCFISISKSQNSVSTTEIRTSNRCFLTSFSTDFQKIFYTRPLNKYVDYYFGKDLLDLHKQVTEQTQKTSKGLEKIIKASKDTEEKINFINDYSNVTPLNRKLLEIILAYLKINIGNTYILQFDQLDDNYNQYSNQPLYFQALVSLFKTVYDINQTFRSLGIHTKILVYLRSDIYYNFHSVDAESARWNDYTYYLNWAIINRTEWTNPRLLRLLDKRINAYPLNSVV